MSHPLISSVVTIQVLGSIVNTSG